MLGVKGRSGDPDGSRDGTLPLAGRFRFKHEPPQDISDVIISWFMLESAAVLRFFGGL